MLSNNEAAKHVRELMLDVYRLIDESLAIVKETCPPEEAAAYSKAVGKVAGAVLMDVLEPLYEKNPELKPPGWDR